MSLHSSLQPDARKTTESRDGASPGEPNDSTSAAHKNLTQVAKQLAAYGGGEVSLDLALDLILNEVVAEARDATGAGGAAIALARDGEMVCRATTGGNAPDLGVRVGTGSGLSGACLRTGQIQECSDTETDARVSAEACRRLGVRSMMIAPLVNGQGTFGILEVFSAQPHAFGTSARQTLDRLARHVAESTAQKERELQVAAEPAVRRENATAEKKQEENAEPVFGEPTFGESAAPGPGNSWNAILIALVIAAAVLLAVAVGFHFVSRQARDGQAREGAVKAAVPAEKPQTPAGTAADAKTATPPAVAHGVEPGGLIVTENGRVIFHQPPSASSTLEAPRVIRRVEPEYPQAARTQQIQGDVVLDVTVLEDGSVGEIEIVKGDALLAEAAVRAVKQWQFQAATADGKPGESQTRITVKFTLPAS